MAILRLQKAVTNTVPTVLSRLCVVISAASRMERLLAQAEYMASQGVKELILVAQETTVYGTDLYGKKTLHHSAQESSARSKASAGSVFCTVIRRRFTMN